MANFPRVNLAGWGVNDPLTSAQQNQLDIDHTSAPNFDAGSAHSPLANIEMTGPNGLKLMGTQKLLYEARTITRLQPLLLLEDDAAAEFNANFNWESATKYSIYQKAAATPYCRLWLSSLPHGAVLSQVEVQWQGKNGHAADPVTCTVPILTVYSVGSTGTVTNLGSQADTVTGRALYEAAHPITVTGLAHTINLEANWYAVEFFAEDAPDFIAGGLLHSLLTRCVVSAQSEY